MEPNSSRRRRSRTSPRRRLAVSLEAEAKGWPPTSLRVFAHHLCDDGPHPGVRVTLPAPRVTLEWTCKGVRVLAALAVVILIDRSLKNADHSTPV